ncbi:MAG TPA: L-aspartate oxidase [Fibrobacteraceae bacterium]|nr:L-aspartate oxidase [Fibrobacteraceae bacterium]
MHDVLVIGAGIAGLTAALKAAADGASVLVLSKAIRSGIGSTNLAQGGIATVTEVDDSFDAHIADTLEAGAGLCKKDRVRILAESGPATIRQLVEWGVRFSHEAGEGTPFRLALEGGHSHRRILHAADLTGKEIMRALLAKVAQTPHITFLEEQFALDLAVVGKGKSERCIGAWVVDRHNGKLTFLPSHATILATGGCGRLWLHCTNPPLSSGDGIAMAYRAGAVLEDLEFMQFHPTSLYHPQSAQTFLISEAVRGYGGILKNDLGEEIMNGVHPLRSLAPRDIVARAIHREMARSGKPCVWLDVTHRDSKEIPLRFPNIYKHCKQIGVDMTKDWIPVVPAAHYMCGGVRVDSWSRTSVPGLFACGEVSATGVHGANRLASNSLLESVVFALRACAQIRKEIPSKRKSVKPTRPPFSSISLQGEKEWNRRNRELQRLMWDKCGIVRSLAGLTQGQDQVNQWQKESLAKLPKRAVPLAMLEYLNHLQNATLILQAALHRKESRGLHSLVDYPEKRESQRKHYSIKREAPPINREI